MKISVIIPSRQRFNLLNGSMWSLINNAYNSDDIEFLIKLDTDDPELQYYKGLLATCNKTIIVEDRGGGYRDLHLFVNKLCSLAKGQWIFLFNDDAKMYTKNWDLAFEKYNDKICCLNPLGNSYNIFPVVNKRVYDILGHISLNNHYDTYITDVCNQAGCHIRMYPPMRIDHLRDGLDDVTSKESAAVVKETSPKYYTSEVEALVQKDVALLKEHLHA